MRRTQADEFKAAPNANSRQVGGIAGHAQEDLVRLVETQIHSSGSLARFALDKTAQMSPPMIELALDAGKSIIEAGASAVDELGSSSLKAVVAVENKLRPGTPKRKPRVLPIPATGKPNPP